MWSVGGAAGAKEEHEKALSIHVTGYTCDSEISYSIRVNGILSEEKLYGPE
ncbi:hypothetical protein KDK_65550 [Dictyobacter kobayashii]|uniref:Uncharacterized protein n=1 Tax=Dictyobacter kobayashii TaxID=2014872 RepID=A0A402AUL2_9CHLR|nr:hypothetical protein KDK_65550 [Dictyobacter kobayashii]